MARLEQLHPGVRVEGLTPSGPAVIVQVERHGSGAATVVYRDQAGHLGDRILFRSDEEGLRLIADPRPWPLDADPAAFRLASEALRIRLAHLFDPFLAVTTSLIEPLPHQITAVYGDMLPRLPLRFLLADDPGAGKTIMTGLLIKELLIRGDLRRCLIVCPGSLIPQWQVELEEKFGLEFHPLSNDLVAAGANPFLRYDLLLARMDHLARNLDTFRPMLELVEWDLVVVDEAHKMSVRWEGDELRRTKRRQLGELLASPERTRHLLLLTATPHNGKDDEFYAFLGLLDADRFEGRIVSSQRRPDVSDLMRRLSKEQLVRFDGAPLFPPRFAHTAAYQLSPPERSLYEAVTAYVREQMNRAERLRAEGDRRRGQIVGLALTILQRRLASSPEAIYQTLCRRKARLEEDLREARRGRGGPALLNASAPPLDEDEYDEDDATAAEREEAEEQLATTATAARTVAELSAEIQALEGLIEQAAVVRASGVDSKWSQLSTLLQADPLMFTADRRRHKLIVFTEHRDTLCYLADKIRDLLGRPQAVVTIAGGMDRTARQLAQERFLQDPETWILVATDAAGEGVNLQQAHLVVNYDLPWNPNRLEQRFGRVHRIGQTEACHMWSLLALGTREADVFETLLRKLGAERQALPGYVFDVLGQAFRERSLRELLIEAIRHGNDPAVQARIRAEVEELTDLERVRRLAAEQGLVGGEELEPATVREVRERLLRASAQRLQPHHIGSFFREAFRALGGRLREREPGRYEITHVPLEVRDRARALGARAPVLERYERIAFEPERVRGSPEAAFVCPGHGLFDAVLHAVLERHQALLRRGTVLLDPQDWGEEPSWLWYLEHEVACSNGRSLSKRLLFLRERPDGTFLPAGPAPHLDLRPLGPEQRQALEPMLAKLVGGASPEQHVLDHAITHLVPEHLDEVRRRHEARIAKTMQAVRERLVRQIQFWDRRAQELREEERAGKQPRMNAERAENRAKDLQERLERRLRELEAERQVEARSPVLVAGALIIPQGLLARLGAAAGPPAHARETMRVEALAMQAVLDRERAMGFEPRDVSGDKCGYDVESRTPDGELRFIEVKGRVEGADTITVTRNEIMTALNEPERFFLALVRVTGDRADPPVYVRRPFEREPDFAAESVVYRITDLLRRAESV